jgi:hypothetical protein
VNEFIICSKMVADTTQSVIKRGEAAIAAGGISEKDRVEGAVIPDGWKLDHQLDYWLPPNVLLF